MIHFISFTSYLNLISLSNQFNSSIFSPVNILMAEEDFYEKKTHWNSEGPEFWISHRSHFSLLSLFHSHSHITLSLSHFNLFLFYSYTLTLLRLSIELISTDFTPSKLLTHSAQVMAHISRTSHISAKWDVITWLGLFFCPLFRSHHSDHNDDAITFTSVSEWVRGVETSPPIRFP